MRDDRSAINSILVVAQEGTQAQFLSQELEDLNHKVMLTHSAEEASHLLNDIVFIGCKLDGLLVDYNLRESTGCRVLGDFRDHFPDAAVAMMTDREDISVNIWARTKGIGLLRKPLNRNDISSWARQVGVPSPD